MVPKSVKRFSDDVMVLVGHSAYMRRRVIPLGCNML